MLRRLNVGRAPEWATPGFTRFSRAHALSAVADALVTVGLAGSLFFSVSPDASRRQVLIYLVVTMAPFAVLAPLIGPGIDRYRGGHRWIAVTLYLTRAAIAVALAFALFDLLFYFLALALLVASRASGVLRQALVPVLVDSDHHLVDANARLARLTTLAGFAGGAIGAGLALIGNFALPLIVAGTVFVVAALVASRLEPPLPLPEAEPDALEFVDAHKPLITLSAAAYTVIRASVGAFMFGLVFALRRASEPAWVYGVTLVVYGVGAYAGNLVAPAARRRFGEDRLIAGSLVGMAICAGFGALGASRSLVAIVALVMGVATTLGRQGFDSLVQRQAPHAHHGRWFARFETQFQLGWVLGAAFATAAAVPTNIALAVVAGVLVPSAALYLRAAREAVRFSTTITTVKTTTVTAGTTVATSMDSTTAMDITAPMDDTTAAATIRARVEAADRWLAAGRPQFATIEAATAVDLAASMGVDVPGRMASAIETLRRRATEPGCPGATDDAAAAIAIARELSTADGLSRSDPPPPPST